METCSSLAVATTFLFGAAVGALISTMAGITLLRSIREQFESRLAKLMAREAMITVLDGKVRQVVPRMNEVLQEDTLAGRSRGHGLRPTP